MGCKLFLWQECWGCYLLNLQVSIFTTLLFINPMGNRCRAQKELDPIKFSLSRKIHYQAKTSTSSLHSHIESLHLLEFVEAAQTEKWTIYLTKVKVPLGLGYNLSTLLEALKKPGITIHNLPPSPRCPCDTQENFVPAGEPENDFPPYLTAAFHRFLVRFTTANDQVCTPWIIWYHLIAFFIVH